MKVVVLGSRGHVATPLTAKLVSEGVETTVITRSIENAKAIEAGGANSAIGSVDDVEFLKLTFNGADTVFVVLAASVFDADMMHKLSSQCNNVCDAIISSGIKKVIYLSSIGADSPEIGAHHENESILKTRLKNRACIISVRPTGFFTNFFGYINSIKNEKLITTNVIKGQNRSYVHADDIAQVCYNMILTPTEDKFKVVNVASDYATGAEIEKMIADAVGVDVKWVSITDEDALQRFVGAGMPRKNALLLVNLFSNEKYHEMFDSFEKNLVIGKHRLADFFNSEFADEYNT